MHPVGRIGQQGIHSSSTAQQLGLPSGMFSTKELATIAEVVKTLGHTFGQLPAPTAPDNLMPDFGNMAAQSMPSSSNIQWASSPLQQNTPDTKSLDFDTDLLLPASLKPYQGILKRYGEVRNAKGGFSAHAMRALITRLAPLVGIIETEAKQQGMEPGFALAVMLQESAGKPTALNAKSRAAGLWQFMPETAQEMGLVINDTVDERFNVGKSTQAAMRYLRQLVDRYDGDKISALAAYNWGMGNVDDYCSGKKNQLPIETYNYISEIPFYAGISS